MDNLKFIKDIFYLSRILIFNILYRHIKYNALLYWTDVVLNYQMVCKLICFVIIQVYSSQDI